MKYPVFFDQVPLITVKDPMAKFLGAFENGVVTYSYLDAVKLAGHSCPTVAGAYLMCLKGLKHLYGEDMAIRGEIKVEFKESSSEGVTGVIGNVVSMITGAASSGGFKGIGGQFIRHSLMIFENRELNCSMKLTRLDKSKSVELHYDPSSIIGDPSLKELLMKNIKNELNIEEQENFQKMWQEKVKAILIENFNNQEIIKIVEC